MRLIGVRCGGFLTDLGSFFGDAPTGARGEVPVMCFVVDTGDGVLVFDTGMHEACCGSGAAARYGRLMEAFDPVCPRDALIDARLRQAGYAMSDIRWVTNSHLHFDHVGGNSMFPGARHLVRERELAFARTRLHKATGYLTPEVEWLGGIAEAWDYDDRCSLATGVELVHLPGHTPWHQGLEISFTDGHRFLCLGDAAYGLEAVMTLRPTGFVANAEVTASTLQALKAAADGGTTLLSSHDVDQWRGVDDLVMLHEG